MSNSTTEFYVKLGVLNVQRCKFIVFSTKVDGLQNFISYMVYVI